jgi:hypothetical protein
VPEKVVCDNDAAIVRGRCSGRAILHEEVATALSYVKPPRRCCQWRTGGIGEKGSVDDVGQLPFERPERLGLGVAVLSATLRVGLCAWQRICVIAMW